MTRVLFLFILLANLHLPAAAIDIQVLANPVCLGNTTTLRLSVSVPDTNILNIAWDLNNNGFYTDAQGAEINHLFASAGEHIVGVQLTLTNHTVFFSNNFSIYVHPLPVSEFSIKNACAGKQAVLSTDSVHFSASWQITGPATANLTGNTVSYMFHTPETYQVALILKNNVGCSYETKKNITIHPMPATQFLITPVSCNTFAFEGTNNNCEVIWQFGDNTLLFNQTSAEHTYKNSGVFNVLQYVLTNYGCRDTLSKTIFLPPRPLVKIEIDGDTIINENELKKLTAIVSNTGAVFIWANGTESNILHAAQPGIFTVYASNASLCTDSAKVELHAPPQKPAPLVSNVNLIFTPNNDGYNDMLVIPGYEPEMKCKLQLFSANGKAIYKANNYENNWNGTYKGAIIPAGVYYFVLSCGSEALIKGSINVLK